jgi:hypothetical protein
LALLLLAAAQIGCLLGLAATAWAAGWAAWGRRGDERLLHPLTPCLGLALLGEATLLLATFHLFRPLSLVLVSAVVHVAAAGGWSRLASRLADACRRSPGRVAATMGAAAAAAAGSFCIALFPPSGFDETSYHLPLARAVVTTGGLPWVPELRYPAFPPLAEGLQAAMLAAGGERATHLVSLVALLLTAALLVAWAREALQPGAGWLAAALLVGSPLVVYLAGTGYVDVPLGLFATASLYALWRARRDVAPSWPTLAGAFAGSAAGVKYLGLYCVLVGLVVLATRRPAARALTRFLLGVSATAAIPFGYLVARTGNPVFPFFPRVFGSSDWDVLDPSQPWSARLGRALLLPWNAVFSRGLAGDQPPLSPALLLGLPLLAWAIAARRSTAPRGLRAGTAVLLGFLPLLLVTPAVSHYLAPVLPLGCLLVAVGSLVAWRDLRGRGASAGATALLALAVASPGPLYGAFWLARRGSVPVTDGDRERYLAAVHPRYAALSWLDRRAGRGATVYALHGEHLHAFARGRLLGDWSGPWRYERVVPLLGEPPALHRTLRAMGADYLLLPRRAAPALHGPTASRRFALLHADADGEVWRLLSTSRPRPAHERRGPARTP